MPALRRRPAPTRPSIAALMPDDNTPGTAMTIGDWIINQVNQGVDVITAAQTAGASPPEFMGWMRDGALALAKLNAGAAWDTDFTPDEQDALIFADKVNRAKSTHIARLSAIAEQLCRGALERTETRVESEPDANGTLRAVRQTVTTRRSLPDADLIKWKLEKLEPAVYGAKATLNVTVVDLTDTEAAADLEEKRMLDVARQMGNVAFIEAYEAGEFRLERGSDDGA